MPERFFDYWQQERERLAREMQWAQVQGVDASEVTGLNRCAI
jgi:hypothetical protein